jgi:hypothetical protein
MIASFLTVALTPYLSTQLLGVCFASAQSGLGEATMLALGATLGGESDVLLTVSASIVLSFLAPIM